MQKNDRPAILLVEDNSDQATVLIYFLKNNGFSVNWKNTPESALQAAGEKTYQLVLLDIMLNASQDGFDLCRKFKSEESLKDIPIIMVTARDDVKDRVSGLRSGADDYIVKPFSEDELLARIQTVLKRKKRYDYNEKYRALLENSDDMVLFLDLNGIIEQTNQKAIELLPELNNNSNRDDLLALFDPLFQDSIRSLFSRVAAGFDVSGNSWKLKRTHNEMEIMDVRIVPLTQSGEITGMGCILRDVTSREKTFQAMEENAEILKKEVEHTSARLNDIQQKLIMSEKMAVMGGLAAGIAHELRNPLNIINSSIYYLQRCITEQDEKVREHFRIINQEIQRSEKIISNLLDFSRKSPAERAEVDVNRIIEQTLTLVGKELMVNDIIVHKGLGEIRTCFANPDEMKQVFLNLILNGKDAMPYGGELTVRSYMNGDEWVMLEFSDTGLGISEPIKDKIFDPFFTSGKEGEGLGIGLSIVHAAIERNKGEISFKSAKNQGTTFLLSLPPFRGIKK